MDYCWGESEGYLCYEVIEELPVPEKLQVDELMKNPQRCMKDWMDKAEHDCKYPSFLSRDPMNISELRTLIDEATIAGKRLLKHRRYSRDCVIFHRKFNVWLWTFWRIDETLLACSLHFGGSCRIDTGVLVFPKEFVFEFDDLTGKEVDWQCLCLGVIGLLKTSHGLQNRQHILENLELMRSVFESLKKELC